MENTVTLASVRWDLIAGGFGLFMFGIEFMGDGLKAIAGDKMRDYIDKYTSKPINAVFIGILITIVMQSSSASTAITIGLVRAGLMKLEQAAGIVMGANIGTTVTSFLISLSIDKYALYIVFVGALLICFNKKKKIRYLGNCILGFGLIFYGLTTMGDALSVLKDLPEFESFAIAMSNNSFLSLLAGTILTGIVQASAATIGVMQKIYQAGGLTFQAVLPFIFGANIGTTVTGILAAIGGSVAARRTAGIHTLFNIVGTTIGMILLVPYSNFILWLSAKYNINPMMQVAIAHIIFNTATTIVFYPLLKQMCNLIRKIIPGKEPERVEVNVDELDNNNLESILPSAAINAAQMTIFKMGDVVMQDVSETKDFLNKPGDNEDKEILDQNEALINSLDKKITDYLMKISKNSASTLTEQDSEDLHLHLEVVKNLRLLTVDKVVSQKRDITFSFAHANEICNKC
jgi:phosphate:Na+ symporter